MPSHTPKHNPIRQLVILGGGTAGWMAAAMLANHSAFAQVNICLIESPSIGTIGVGEGSTPHFKRFMDTLGIDETDWMYACHASYKTGIDFINWNGDGRQYFHPFYFAMDIKPAEAFFVNANARRRGHGAPITPDAYFTSGVLAKHNLSPVPKNALPIANEYGYHFDAQALAKYLTHYALARGVQHIQGNVTEVVQAENQHISALILADGQTIKGDFFLDCSGFQAKLIHQTLQVPFQSFSHELLNDSAVTVAIPLPTPETTQVPMTREHAHLANASQSTSASKSVHFHTQATALSAGWLWQIPLNHRTGNGYVYSSRHLSQDDAATELLQSLNLPQETQVRHVKMRVGMSEKAWQHNVLAVGLSQSFMEPLEATSIMLTQFTLEQFADLFSCYQTDSISNDKCRAALNTELERMVLGVKDYIQAHYVCSVKSDHTYWFDARGVTISPLLHSLLYAWYQGDDVDALLHKHDKKLVYFRPSWYALLAGMDYRDPQLKKPFTPLADNINQQAQHYCRQLVQHYFLGTT